MPCFRSGFAQRQGSGGGSFATPDIIVNDSFGAGLRGTSGNWTDGGGGAPSGGNISTDATVHAPSGSASLKRTFTNTGADQAAQVFYNWTNVGKSAQDRVFVRVYFKFTQVPNDHQKWIRFFDGAQNLNFGGIFVGGGQQFVWLTDRENSGEDVDIPGLSSAVIGDGNLHTIEMDYWRNGHSSGEPAAKFWFDGTLITHADGAVVDNAGGGNYHWLSNYLLAGPRASSAQLGTLEVLGVINQTNTIVSSEWMDYIAVSTQRIGP